MLIILDVAGLDEFIQKSFGADINSETSWVGEFVFDKQSIYEEVERAVDRKIKMLHIIYGI